jgi:hypothetical protein
MVLGNDLPLIFCRNIQEVVMAYLRKMGSGFQIQYYLNGKRRIKYLPAGTPKAIANSEKKRIESEIALHKAGIK